MDGIKIVTDNGADLAQDVAKELDITVIPLVVTFGETAYDDTALSRDEFWEMAERFSHPKTSQPSIGVFQRAFQRLVDQGHRVLCTTITSRHSGTYNAACAAAQAFADRVIVFDSRSLSIGQGFQAIRAARMALQGVSMDRILETLSSLRDRTRVLIELDTLEFVRRGGRVDKLMPAIDRIARVLRVKPLLTVVDGELKLLGVARSYKKGLKRIKEDILRLGPLETLGVIHIRCQELGTQMADDLAKLTGISRDQIVLREAGTALSCQGGRGVVAAMGILRSD